jgi:hypothetical protein
MFHARNRLFFIAHAGGVVYRHSLEEMGLPFGP